MLLDRPEVPIPILQCPAVQTARQVIIRCPYFLHIVQDRAPQILGSQYLESLSLKSTAMPVQDIIPGLVKLRRLSVSLHYPLQTSYPSISSIICAIPDAQLEQFDLVAIGLTATVLAEVCKDLHPQFTSLRRLYILADIYQEDTLPLFKELVQSLPILEHLTCGYPMCDADILLHLPPKLRSLTLATSSDRKIVFPTEQCAETVRRYGRSNGVQSGYRLPPKLTIFDRQRSAAPLPAGNGFESLADACRASRITFGIIGTSSETHRRWPFDPLS